MSTSLYELSVASYKRIVDAVRGILHKGADHAKEKELDLDGIVESRVHADMLPFRFQLISVVHHSAGSLRGLRAGESTPPPDLGLWTMQPCSSWSTVPPPNCGKRHLKK